MKLLFLLPTALPSTPLAVTPLGERQRGEEGGRTERERELDKPHTRPRDVKRAAAAAAAEKPGLAHQEIGRRYVGHRASG